MAISLLMIGKIIKTISNRYTVLCNDQSYECIGNGKNKQSTKLVLGDIVEFTQINDKYVISKTHPRKNFMLRPLVANVDQVLLVMSIKEPKFDETLINRLIMQVELNRLKPIIIVTKVDEKNSTDCLELIKKYRCLGYDIYQNSTKRNINPEIIEVLSNKISVLAGQSGVGKSSFLNQLLPGLNLKTNSISQALNRGKHTTTHHELYRFNDALIADTPGFSSLSFENYTVNELLNSLKIFKDHLGLCKYNNCQHLNEPLCFIKQDMLNNKYKSQFYHDYIDILKTIKENKKW